MKKKNKGILPPDKAIKPYIDNIREIGQYTDAAYIANYTTNKTIRKLIMQGYNYSDATYITEKILVEPKSLTKMQMLLNYNNWYYSGKQVYRFDPTLAEMLSSQSKDLPIDTSILEQLPCDTFFVMRERDGNMGFFVDIVNNADKCQYLVSFTELLPDDNVDAIMLPLDKGISIAEAFARTVVESEYKQYRHKYTDVIDSASKIAAEKMQYLLYLAAANAEIKPATKGAVIKRSEAEKAEKEEKQPKESPPSNSKVSNVGYHIGSMIRMSQSDEETVNNKVTYVGGGSKQGAPKAPHIRRSHFHSFWTGSGDNKKIIVKWVHTVFVNGSKDKAEEAVSTVHDVK